MSLLTAAGNVYLGVNVENVAYPEGTCAEAGAIAAMCAAGDYHIAELLVISDSPTPVTPCGGCRQKIAEFAGPEVAITMVNLQGVTSVVTVADLLPGSFNAGHMANINAD